MISQIKMIGIAVSASVFLGLGFMWGSNSAARAHEREVKAVRDTGVKLVDAQIQERRTCEVERDQARGEVNKINETTAAQYAAILEAMEADTAARSVALQRVERSARQAATEAKEAGVKAANAREVIQNVADQCARAGVPDDVVRMLNDIIAAP